MKIKINKVFGKHDIEFDTNTRCTIYIGENGIGKSTSMKIISNILNKNFVDILKFDFDSIDFFDEQVHYKVKYSDLYIDVDQMKNKFKYEIYANANEQYEKNMNNSDFEYDPYLKPCYDYLVRNSDSYDRLIKNVFTGKKLKKDDEYLLNEWFFQVGEFKYFLEDLKKKVSSNLTIAPIKCYNYTVFNKNYDLKSFICKSFENVNFYLNMATEYNILNDLDAKFVFNNIDKNMIKSEKKYPNESIFDRMDFVNGINPQNIPLELLTANYRKEKFVPKYEVRKIIDEKTINFSELLFNKTYDKDILEEFSQLYYNFLHNDATYSNINDYDAVYNELFTGEDEFINTYFLKPLIPKHSYYYNLTDESKKKLLNQFKEKIYIRVKNALNPINDLIKKYIKNKNIIATPSGIVISLEKDGTHNDLDFNSLSAGEKKLIIIFIMHFSFNKVDFSLDEPENSLSLIWQKDIVSDLLDSKTYKRIIVCTQSPFIVNDRLNEYVVCLPLEDIYE